MEDIDVRSRAPSRNLAESLLEDDQTKKRKNSAYLAKKTGSFFLHLRLLLTKNITVQRRSLKALGIQLFMPVIICILIFTLQFFANLVVNQSVQNPPVTNMGPVPQCYVNSKNPDNCTTIAYAVVGTEMPWMHSVMNYVAKDNNLTNPKDLKFMGSIQPSNFTDYLSANLNRTQLGVIFCNSEWSVSENLTIPCQFERKTSKQLIFYSIVYNASELFSSFYTLNTQGAQPKDPVAASLKISLDNAIIAYFQKDTLAKGDQNLVLDPADPNTPKIRNVHKSEFPRSFLRFMIGVDLVTSTGALQFFVPYMVNFIFIVLEIVREKEKRLRQGLAVMGMSHGAYWISWILTSTLINFLMTTILVGMGLCFEYPFFTDTPFIIVFMLFFLFGQALQSLAFWITTICNDSKTAYTVAFSALLISVVLQAFLATSYISFMFFIIESPIWFDPIRILFQLVPSFNFALIFGQITLKSGSHYDLNNNYWAKGKGFTYDDLFEDTTGNINGTWYLVPEPIIFYGILLGNTVLYLLLTWYCDNIIAHNRGTGKSLIFCLKRAPKKRQPNQNGLDQLGFMETGSASEATSDSEDTGISDSVKKEKENMIQRQIENNRNDGLRILNLAKSYSGSRRGGKVKALKNLFMGIDSGELLGLLGPNGAGKTTLIGVLTGLLSPSEGTAIIDGLDIRHEIDDVREVIGVCPQFDILWDELTAEDHLYMFAKLKRIPEHLIQNEIDERLKGVNLFDMKYVMTKAYSGGMKRRLSIAIALIGNPKIVFLDEPTTGMDPKNRQYIWQLIQKMKKGRAVMLTTHAMEEADALSDRIAIIMKGQLRCIGTPIFLKNTYGDGYRLSLIIDQDDVEGTIEYIKSKLPSGRIIDSSGGSVIVGIPLSKGKEMQAFIKMIEDDEDTPEKKEFQKRIKDWGLRHSTLEEVFMKVSKESKAKDI